MSLYEYYENCRNFCLVMARVNQSKKETKLFTFYRNAADGFRAKQLALKMSEARKRVI